MATLAAFLNGLKVLLGIKDKKVKTEDDLFSTAEQSRENNIRGLKLGLDFCVALQNSSDPLVIGPAVFSAFYSNSERIMLH